MSRQFGKIFIGTSGYSYPHWQGIFYPENLPPSEWLEYYCQYFDTVELNVTFYRLPRASAFQNWRRRTPKNFLFVCKGSRFITHVKKLNKVKEPTKLFLERVSFLKEKLGPVLWQFAPAWKINASRLKKFLALLSNLQKKIPSLTNLRHVVEFRHLSWFCPEVYKILKQYNISLCIADSPSYPLVKKITADFVYLRFHGGQILYGSEYSEKELKNWAKKIKKWQKQGLDIFVYFNNDTRAFAIKNAEELKQMVRNS